jgi:hypothetical protein
MNASSSPRQRGRFTPRLESLEDRLVPALHLTALGVSVMQFGTLVQITGASTKDMITILDNGTDNDGAVQVTFSPKKTGATSPFFSHGKVTLIAINTKGGNDTVSYTLSQAGADTASRSIHCELGSGKDSFAGKIADGLAGGARWEVSVHGGSGKDSERFDCAGRLEGGSNLSVSLFGDSDRDTIKADWSVRLPSQANVVFKADGGSGKDNIDCNFIFGPIATEFGGRFSADVFGGSSKDTLHLSTSGSGNLTLHHAQIDGGGNDDVCRAEGGATAINCVAPPR